MYTGMIGKLSIKETNEANFFMAMNERECGFPVPFLHELSLQSFIRNNIYPEYCLINEATYEFEQDIKYIYENYVKPFITLFLKDSKPYLESFKKDNFILYKRFNSKELPSDISKQAHKTNPINIGIGILSDNSFYLPKSESIFISILPAKLLISLNKNNISFRDLGKEEKQKFAMIMSEPNAKATIAHELSHWLDDSLKNKSVLNYVKKIEKKNKTYIDAEIDNLSSHIEIQGYIHGLKELKNHFSQKEWDSFTYKDVFNFTVLKDVIKALKKEKGYFKLKKWIKKFFSRMARENLIGKNMKTQDLNDIFQIK